MLLAPALGFTNDKPIIVAMALYTLVILVRNIVEGDPRRAGDRARRGRRHGLPTVRAASAPSSCPLALPGIVAGLRLATVSTVSLISVGALIGRGGLGRLFADGYDRRITIELWAGLIAVVALALVLDAMLVLVGRWATPWTRDRRPAEPVVPLVPPDTVGEPA